MAGLSRLEARTNGKGGRIDLELRMDGLVCRMYVHWRDGKLGKTNGKVLKMLLSLWGGGVRKPGCCHKMMMIKGRFPKTRTERGRARPTRPDTGLSSNGPTGNHNDRFSVWQCRDLG